MSCLSPSPPSSAAARALLDPPRAIGRGVHRCRHQLQRRHRQSSQSIPREWSCRRGQRRSTCHPIFATPSAVNVQSKIGAGSWTSGSTAAGPGAHRTPKGVNFVLETPADEVKRKRGEGVYLSNGRANPCSERGERREKSKKPKRRSRR